MNNFNLTNKKAFTLLELIFSIVISSIILFTSLSILKTLGQENQKTFNLTIDKIDFETTRLFLEKKIKEDATLSNLTISEKTLFYNGDILIQNVTTFTKMDEGNGININLCKDTNGEFCTQIYLQK
ncbi:MAG: prepilin-type N-terminal cleavage/methylation domain-containing protein [Arcobacteraceae bacterium]|nr:prepilin-type N-terminal cleavage/methylation domain-containing protein [Arcobacteraceae bacterium]